MTTDLKLSELLSRAAGVDRDWMNAASCQGWGHAHYDPKCSDAQPTPWMVSNNESVKGIAGHELIEYALIICQGCVAQYDCAKFAIRTDCDFGTSSMPIGSLRWLRAQEDWEEIVDVAEAVHIPMRQAVVTVRRRRA